MACDSYEEPLAGRDHIAASNSLTENKVSGKGYEVVFHALKGGLADFCWIIREVLDFLDFVEYLKAVARASRTGINIGRAHCWPVAAVSGWIHSFPRHC